MRKLSLTRLANENSNRIIFLEFVKIAQNSAAAGFFIS